MKKKHFFGVFVFGVMITGCSPIQLKEASPPQRVTVDKIEGWDSCAQRPEAETRPVREAQEAQRRAAQRQTEEVQNPEGTAPVQQGTEEQALGAVGGAIQGAGVGLMADIISGADSPAGLMTGALVGAIGAIVLLSETPEDIEQCYNVNRIIVRNQATGKTVDTYLRKKRDPDIEKRRMLFVLEGWENGSENIRVGDKMILYTAHSRAAGQNMVQWLMTEADYQRLMEQEGRRVAVQ